MKYLICGFLFLSACARPDYIDPKIASQNQQPTTSCTLELANSELCASVEWTTGPQSPQESEFILKFWKNTDTPQGPYLDPSSTLSVILWMPSMGHGSSPVTIEKIQDGVYRVRRVFFIMPGDWEVRVFLKNGTTTVGQATVSLLL
ncbi:FixH family protein [Bdellovibrio sp. HCB209]|uniref:FixH family protein n=1 Tax=Bdellovibrio sp. HCB209 TaxID=3394354 RepID=UPI0039B6D567